MLVDLFLRGAAIGFSIAAPVGPIGAMCIRKTLSEGRIAGLATGLGAAAADTLYGAISVCGVSAVSTFLWGSSFWMKALGGLFLCCLGVKTLLGAAQHRSFDGDSGSKYGVGDHLRSFLNTFVITLSNPMTVLCFAAVFSSIGAIGCSGTDSGAVVTGVFAGSSAWWLLLTGVVGALKNRLSRRAIIAINLASASLIIIFGASATFSAFSGRSFTGHCSGFGARLY